MKIQNVELDALKAMLAEFFNADLSNEFVHSEPSFIGFYDYVNDYCEGAFKMSKWSGGFTPLNSLSFRITDLTKSILAIVYGLESSILKLTPKDRVFNYGMMCAYLRIMTLEIKHASKDQNFINKFYEWEEFCQVLVKRISKISDSLHKGAIK